MEQIILDVLVALLHKTTEVGSLVMLEELLRDSRFVWFFIYASYLQNELGKRNLYSDAKYCNVRKEKYRNWNVENRTFDDIGEPLN